MMMMMSIKGMEKNNNLCFEVQEVTLQFLVQISHCQSGNVDS